MPLTKINGEWVFTSNADYRPIDVTDTSEWTLVDPRSVVSAYSIDADGYMTFTFNAVTTNKSQIYYANNGNASWPRWYKKLTLNNGEPIQLEDLCTLAVLWDTNYSGTYVDDFKAMATLGFTIDPTSTSSDTHKGVASFFQTQGDSGTTARTYGGIGTLGSGGGKVASTNANDHALGFGLVSYGGGTRGGVNHGSMSETDGSTTNMNDQNAAGTRGIANTDVYLMLTIGANTTNQTINASDQMKFKVKYKVFKRTIGQ